MPGMFRTSHTFCPEHDQSPPILLLRDPRNQNALAHCRDSLAPIKIYHDPIWNCLLLQRAKSQWRATVAEGNREKY